MLSVTPDDARLLGDVKLIARIVRGVSRKDLRVLVNEEMRQIGAGIVAIISLLDDGEAAIVVGVTSELTDIYNAVALAQRGVMFAGGSGGNGRPHMAQAGGFNGSQAEEALERIANYIRSNPKNEWTATRMRRVIERIENTPPACLSGLQATQTQPPRLWDDNHYSAWRIACPCGCAHGRLLGLRLENCGQSICSPLAFECTECGAVTEIFDSDQHGYDAELDKEEIALGIAHYSKQSVAEQLEEYGPRQFFQCTDCDGDSFTFIFSFIFWNIDALAQEEDWDWENFFSVIVDYCRCDNCARTSLSPANFDACHHAL
jgi:hypothetical protein